MRELAAQRAAWSGCAKHPARALATLLLLLTCWPTQLECKQSAPAVEAAPAAPPPLPSPTVAGGAELATGSPGTISQQQVYRSPDGNGTEAVLAPNVAVAGDVVAETTAETVQACSAACRAAGANCTVFAYCDSPGGCSDGAGGDMAFQQCRFLDIGCNPGTRPPVVAAGPAVTVTSGFPAGQCARVSALAGAAGDVRNAPRCWPGPAQTLAVHPPRCSARPHRRLRLHGSGRRGHPGRRLCVPPLQAPRPLRVHQHNRRALHVHHTHQPQLPRRGLLRKR